MLFWDWLFGLINTFGTFWGQYFCTEVKVECRTFTCVALSGVSHQNNSTFNSCIIRSEICCENLLALVDWIVDAKSVRNKNNYKLDSAQKVYTEEDPSIRFKLSLWARLASSSLQTVSLTRPDVDIHPENAAIIKPILNCLSLSCC